MFSRISKDFYFETDIQTKSSNNSKSITDKFYPLKLERGENSVFTLKLLEPSLPNGFVRCLAGSFAVHAPDFVPTFIDYNDFRQIVYGMTLDVIISPEITRTEENLRKLNPSARECYFEGERKLKFFKTYSLANCEEECFSKMIFEHCDCVPFNKPRVENMAICLMGSNRGSCEAFIKSQLDINSTLNFSTRQNCSCLPTCNSVKYNVKYFSRYHSEGSNETVLNFIMNTEDIVVYRHYEAFTVSDVISYTGGLLGLFAGISVLSIVEFFYFFFVRSATNVYKFLRP